MDIDLGQLRALAAVVAEGTLDAAARSLHVTPSAVSQRLKALESATGRVLVVRSRPARATPSGEAVLRLARQVDLLVADTAAELGAVDAEADGAEVPRPSLPIAVNADSLTTWVLPALASLAGTVTFDLHREDQEHTGELLRAGTVVAAITAQRDPVAGCSSVRLGVMRYRPVAAPAFAARWFADGVTRQALAAAPVVVFDRRDDLQHRYLRGRARGAVDPPVSYVPASADFATAVRLGLGWGLLPDLQSADLVERGELVLVEPRAVVDVVLYWQQWRLRSASVDRVAEAIRTGARTALGPVD